MDFVPLLLSLAGQPLAFYSFAIHSTSVSLRTMTPGIYLDVYLEFVDEIQGVQKLGWTKYILFFFFLIWCIFIYLFFLVVRTHNMKFSIFTNLKYTIQGR